MRYFKRLKIYKNSTGTNVYNPLEKTAFSYNWWQYLRKINGVLVFNNYTYSSSTSKHQSDLQYILRTTLGVNFDEILFVYTRSSLDGADTVKEYVLGLFKQITRLELTAAKKGTRKKTNENRYAEIETLYNKISNICLKLDLKIDSAEIEKVKIETTESFFKTLEREKEERKKIEIKPELKIEMHSLDAIPFNQTYENLNSLESI